MRVIVRMVTAAALVGLVPGLEGAALAAEAECRIQGVSVDDRIRVVSPELGRRPMAGRLASADGDALWLARPREGGKRRVSWCSIDRLEVARGTRRQTGKGAKIGLLFPGVPLALAGMGFMLGGQIDCEHSCLGYTALAIGAVGGLAAGAGIGAAVGSLDTTERWEPVSRDKIRVIVEPRRDGIGAAVALRF